MAQGGNMIRLDADTNKIMEGEVEHEATERVKTKNGKTRTKLVFIDNAGFTRTMSPEKPELESNEGIKGFGWLAAVPHKEWDPIYEKLVSLHSKYGKVAISKLSDEELAAKVQKERAKLEKLMALLELKK